ncbi:hypothetical protein QUW33_07295 [Lactobacillus gallinarum]|uniref:hypothetical protein n=1 Tax=Lactobacillus gallinarum TaxID=52242 RepID=UPI0025A312E9|nr:hypothetical protein [Lactobacillus gallinarum]MDM8277225.1 hypothetical protein [Lactobacillus gallinarum]
MSDKQFSIYDILNEAGERIPEKKLTFHDVDEALIQLSLQSQPYFDEIQKEAVILYLSRQDTIEKLENAEIKNKFLEIKLEITDNQLRITRDIIQSKLDRILNVLNSEQ